MKTINQSGRISVKNRQAIVEAVRELATTKDLHFNTIMSAVLWAGTKMNARMCVTNLKKLITLETVLAYQTEVARRENYHTAQVKGIIRNALPKNLRTEANINELFAARPISGVSLKALRVWVEEQAVDFVEPA
jgi:hypothetical protein